MQNLSDNDLDKHFQEAAEKHRPPFEPAAWNAMQERLDLPGEVSQRPITLKRSLPFLLVFLAGSITGILTWSYFTVKTDPTQNSLTSMSSGVSPDNPSLEGGTVLPNTTIDDTITKQHLTQANQTGSSNSSPPYEIKKADETGKVDETAKQQTSIRISSKEIYPVHRSEPTSSNEKKQEAAINAPASAADNTMERQTESSDGAMTSSGNHDQKITSSVNPSEHYDTLQLMSDPVDASDSIDNANAIIPQPSEPLTENEDKRPVSRYKVSIIAGLSPDFSSVNFGQQTKPGINFAGLIELHLTSRLSLMTGLISSKKLYKARDLEYYGQAYPEAEGDCRIIDIPLNVYYRFGGNSRFSWFAGAGASSYIMKKETYVFYYDSPYGKASYDKEVRNENHEWFKVLNLSAGVSRKISPRLYIEAEPFVKVPFRGIGDGHLNVTTAGMFVRMRYSLIKTHY